MNIEVFILRQSTVVHEWYLEANIYMYFYSNARIHT